MKTHLLIPARYHSTRLPAKPLLPIHGVPMILWTAKKAAAAVAEGVVDDYYVATDHDEIFALCQASGVPVVMSDAAHASGTDRLAEVGQRLGFADDDVVINLQGDEPLVPSLLLAQLKALLLAKPNCAMATLCEPICELVQLHAPSVVKVVKSADNEALYFSRAPIPHHRDNPELLSDSYRHLGLYAYRMQVLRDFAGWEQGVLERLESLEQLRMLENGARIAIDVAKVSLPAGVDTPEDLARLNALPLAELECG